MSYKFLVVDDTNFMRKMATDCLMQYGHEVVGEATNGKEAIRLYNELQPDIVMMDLTMPEMNGIDAIKEILKINADAVMLVCSASNQRDMIFEALDAGAKGYLMKPFKPDHMNDIIRKYAEPYLPSNDEPEAVEKEDVTEEEETVVEIEDFSNETAKDEKSTEKVTDEVAAATENEVIHTEPCVEPEVSTTVEVLELHHDVEGQTGGNEQFHVEKGADEHEKRVRTRMPKIENKIKFVTSYTCNWEEEIQGSNKNYSFTFTENDKNISIEMRNGSDDSQKIQLSLDGFRQLFGWLEGQLEEESTKG